MRLGLDVRPEDRFWNVADPGWGYGMAYTVIGPLLLGHPSTLHEGGFTVDGMLRVLTGQQITNLAAAPTVYRLLMAAGETAMAPIAGKLRIASSAGEPLSPVPPNTPGVLAVERGASPLLCFDGYWRAETPAFRGKWYLTGDTMQQDEDGHYYFVGRNDDIITSSGYRIGPFDVESSIMEHPAVAEVAVIGKPDPERTEIVKAFIVLRTQTNDRDRLAKEIQQHVRTRQSLHA